MLLDREEYVEQAHFFAALRERMKENLATQDLMEIVRQEALSTTRLPMAIDFMAGELRHSGVFAPAMARLSHYFAPFQTFVVEEAENERGRFDFRVALSILEREAKYRADGPTRQGMFFYQFEVLCRNRLSYDRGLKAISLDPVYDTDWAEWILTVRRQVGLVDFADFIYVRSALYVNTRAQQSSTAVTPERPVLFGEKEGKIALANRQKDPLFLFSALQRHLNYPAVPRLLPPDATQVLLPELLRRVDRLEHRIKLLEEEARGGIDLAKFYLRPPELGREADPGRDGGTP